MEGPYSAKVVQIEERGVSTGQRIGWRLERGVADGHLQEEARVEEGFEDGAGYAQPRGIVLRLELPVGSLANVSWKLAFNGLSGARPASMRTIAVVCS